MPCAQIVLNPRQRRDDADCGSDARRAALTSAERLTGRGDGEISLVVMLGPEEGEVELKLPGKYPVTGALAGALKAVAGVVAVEHV